MTNAELIEDLHQIAHQLDWRDKNVGLQVAAMIQHNRITAEKNAGLTIEMEEWKSLLKSFLPPTIPTIPPTEFPPVKTEEEMKGGDLGNENDSQGNDSGSENSSEGKGSESGSEEVNP